MATATFNTPNMVDLGQGQQVSYKLTKGPKPEKTPKFELVKQNMDVDMVLYMGTPFAIVEGKSYELNINHVYPKGFVALTVPEADPRRHREYGPRYTDPERREKLRVSKDDDLEEHMLLVMYRHCKVHDEDEYVRGLVIEQDPGVKKGDVKVFLPDYADFGVFPKERFLYAQTDIYLQEFLSTFAFPDGLEFLSMHDGLPEAIADVVQRLNLIKNTVQAHFTRDELKGNHKVQVEVAPGISLTSLVLEEFIKKSVIEISETERKTVKGYVSHVEKNGTIYIQTENSIVSSVADWLMAEGEDILTDLIRPDSHRKKVLNPVDFNRVYIARFGEGDERSLFRAKIYKQEGDNFHVEYIDYGNTDVVKRSDLYFAEQIHPGLETLPPLCQAFRMKFVARFIHVKNFKNMLGTSPLEIDIRHEMFGTYNTVVLKLDGRNLNMEVCKNGWATKSCPGPSEVGRSRR